MLVQVPKDGDPYLVCEDCGAILLLPKRVPIINIWREHARFCPDGCVAPPLSAKYLKLTRLASG